ncbi:hypothetical protein HPB49_026671 [Dermacentor silvarum]|nr:hypothetical protein HPB49_026671 [Dermacentor silvarum]
MPQYPEHIEWLLRTHRCIASVYLRLSIVEYTSLSVLDALPHSPGTKTVTLCFEDMQAFGAALKVIPCFTEIEELRCETSIIYDALPEGCIAALSTLLHASSCLKSLCLSLLRLIGPVTDTLFTNLLLNKHKLKELYLLDCVLACDSYPYALTEYLGTTTALNHLAVDMPNDVVQKAILEGILKNRSIDKLRIGGLIENEESLGLVAAVVRKNCVIRNLRISIRADPTVGPLPVYGYWLAALTQNDTLEEVSFPLKVFRPSEWATFFRALPNKENLKKVHINAGFDHCQVLPVWAEVESLGLEEKVSVTFSWFACNVELLRCKAISKIQFSAGEPDDRLVSAFHLLPNFQHVSDLRIELKSGSMRLSLALAEYLISTTALRCLVLTLGWDIVVEAEGASPWWSVIHKSLSRNKSLRELSVSVERFSTQDIEGLADSLQRSRNIRFAKFINVAQNNTSVFVRRLSKSIADNWTLLNLLCACSIEADVAGHWFAVCDTTRRNSGLVARAARFVKASHLDR